jgi:hypothetical protein
MKNKLIDKAKELIIKVRTDIKEVVKKVKKPNEQNKN